MTRLVCSVLLSTCWVVSIQAETYTYVGGTDGAWNQAGNWEDSGGGTSNWPDGSDDKAIVPTGKAVLIAAVNAVAGDLDVDGTIKISNAGTLKISKNSTIDGEIRFVTCEVCAFQNQLIIDDSLTLSGTGKVIGGFFNGDLDHGEILGSSGANTLTVDEFFTLTGDLTITVKLTNNGTVSTTHPKDTLLLKTNLKDGNGEWRCEDGTFTVDSEVTGSGDWFLIRASTSNVSKMVFTSDSDVDDLSGDFTIKGGLLDVNNNLCTTGDLAKFKSPSNNTTTRISVASGKTVKFKAGSCP